MGEKEEKERDEKGENEKGEKEEEDEEDNEHKKKSKWHVTNEAEIQHGDLRVKISKKFDLGGDIWIVALYDHGMLEMVKIKVTGQETYKWLATKLDKDPEKRCLSQKTFKPACFKGEDAKKDDYIVHLKASEVEEGDEKGEKKEEEEEDEEEER